MRRNTTLFFTIAACTSTTPDAELTPRTGCDPLDPALCALPFPSAYFLTPAETETGFQVAWTPEAAPENIDGVVLDPTRWNEKDGFSTASPMLAFFPNLSLDGHLSHVDLGRYDDALALTVLLDLTTGARVPHWVELDGLAENAEEQLTVIRPAVPLDWNHDYVVAFRNLRDTSGAAIPASEAFAALRDGVSTDQADIEDRRARFDDVIFPALEATGFPRDELTLAWDFHTTSRSNTLGRLEHVRDDAMAFVEEGPIDYTITKVEDTLESCASGGHIARHIEGEFTMPLWVDNDTPPAWLTRGSDGMPVRSGETSVSFTMRVPCSVALHPDEPLTLLQYGHGLLGGHDEVEAGWLADLSDEMRFVPFGVSWTGMKSEDYAAITLIVALDPSNFGSIPERLHQGLAESLVALEFMRREMVDDPNLAFDGQKILHNAPFAYYGNSQGGILGGALMGLSPRLTRGVLGVGGGPYSLLLPRSHDFDDFFRIFDQKYEDSRVIALLVQGMLQQLWDPAESSGWLHDMGDKQLLLQVGVGDAQVSTLGAHITARGWGVKLLEPAARPVWGLETAQPGFAGSALVEWAYSDVPAEPVDQLPPEQSTDTHECPRREPAAKAQLRDFVRDGVVNHYCDGPCVGLRQVTCP